MTNSSERPSALPDGIGADGGKNGDNLSLASEVERLSEALEAAREQFRDAVLSVQEGFVVFDRDQCLVLCNDTYRNFFLDAVGQEVADLVVPGAY